MLALISAATVAGVDVEAGSPVSPRLSVGSGSTGVASGVGVTVGASVALAVGGAGGSDVAVGTTASAGVPDGTGVGAAGGSGVTVDGTGVAVGSVVAQAVISHTQSSRPNRDLFMATPFSRRPHLAARVVAPAKKPNAVRRAEILSSRRSTQPFPPQPK